MDQIADFIEEVLNKPVKDMIIRQKTELMIEKNKGMPIGQRFSKIRRLKKFKPKVYFQFIMGEDQFYKIPGFQQYAL